MKSVVFLMIMMCVDLSSAKSVPSIIGYGGTMMVNESEEKCVQSLDTDETSRLKKMGYKAGDCPDNYTELSFFENLLEEQEPVSSVGLVIPEVCAPFNTSVSGDDMISASSADENKEAALIQGDVAECLFNIFMKDVISEPFETIGGEGGVRKEKEGFTCMVFSRSGIEMPVGRPVYTCKK